MTGYKLSGVGLTSRLQEATPVHQVVALEDIDHVPQRLDVLRRGAIYDQNVSLLAPFQRPDLVDPAYSGSTSSGRVARSPPLRPSPVPIR